MDMDLKLGNLSQRLVEIEKSLYDTQQHGRKWNIEIAGIPASVGDESDTLEKATLKILEAIGVKCDVNDIDTIHRLPAPKNTTEKSTIVRFSSRKKVREVFRNKHKLQKLDTVAIESTVVNSKSIFINPSFCVYFKKLAYNCRILKRNNLISSIYTDHEGNLKVKKLDGKWGGGQKMFTFICHLVNTVLVRVLVVV